jgi:TonB family protein
LSCRRIAVALTLCLAFLPGRPVSANEDALSKVRELYLSADYEGALAALEQLHPTSDESRTEMGDYRVLSLLALDRGDQAQQAIKSIVEIDPFHHLTDLQASPRVQAVFRETRKALLPDIVHRLYDEAKASFDRHDSAASGQFDRLLALLDDPDLKDAQLSDLRAVATGFRDLSSRLRMPPAPAAPPPVEPPPLPRQPPAPAAPVPTKTLTGPPDRIRVTPKGASLVITPKEPPAPGFEPPLAIAQPVPPWTKRTAAPKTHGVLELAIDEQGNVTTVVLQRALEPAFDQALIKAARTWKYLPARLNGRPVPFLKVIEIQIQSEP